MDDLRPFLKMWAPLLLSLTLLFGCAPIDDVAPDTPEQINQIAQAGGSGGVASCVPSRIISLYDIRLSEPNYWNQYNETDEVARKLQHPCGGWYAARDSFRDPNTCAGYLSYEIPTPLPPNPIAQTPVGGNTTYPVSSSAYNTCYDVAGGWYWSSVDSDWRYYYVMSVDANDLRNTQQNLLSWAQSWQETFRTSPGAVQSTYNRRTYHSHRAVIFRRNTSSGRWTDEIQFAANAFDLNNSSNQPTACATQGTGGGQHTGYVSGTRYPRTIRYVNCVGGSQDPRDARPILSTTGTNAWSEWYSTTAPTLGQYLSTTTGPNPTLCSHVTPTSGSVWCQ